MGLLLSVLVACVGVVELLAFYSNVTRTLLVASTRTTLTDLNRRYREDFEKHAVNITKTDTNHVSVGKNVASSEPEKDRRLTEAASSEEVELEFSENVKRSPSPGRFLLREKENGDRSRSPSPRRFLVSEEATVSNDLRKFVVQRTNHDHFVVRDEDEKKEALFPLPKQFIVTEREPEESPRSSSPAVRTSVEEDAILRRSPSPYPSLVLSVPRNSVCSELLDNPSFRVVEAEEESLSPAPEKKVDRIFEQNGLPKSNNLEVPTSRRYSRSPEPEHSNEIDDDDVEYDEHFLDSLDGVKKKKLHRSSSSVKSRKKKASDCNNEGKKEDCLSSSSVQNNSDAATAKTLTEAANLLKNVNGGSTAGASKDGHSKNTAEPFWVKR